MTQIVSLSEVSDAHRSGVISIGNFDGVHRGHAALLCEVRRLADQLAGPATAVVLNPHPASILRPQHSPERLTWIERRAELMSPLGIDFLVVCETTREFLQLSAETFFESLVVRQLAAGAMVEGPNFFFGRDRGGDVPLLRWMCEQAGVELTIVAPASEKDEMISSTRIRKLLSQGNIADASELLGSFHRIRGRVVAGAKRGRGLGFPTANVSEVDVVIPSPGVYGGFDILQDKRYPAAIHIGPTPTFADNGTSTIEVHLLDFDGDLYGTQLLVDFVHPVREIARFDSADQLAEQLARDIESIRSRLASLGNHES